MTHSDIKAWCAKCGEPADVIAERAPASLTIGVPCDCDAGIVFEGVANDRQQHAIRRAKEVLRVGMADDTADPERLTRYMEEALELLSTFASEPQHV